MSLRGGYIGYIDTCFHLLGARDVSSDLDLSQRHLLGLCQAGGYELKALLLKRFQHQDLTAIYKAQRRQTEDIP